MNKANLKFRGNGDVLIGRKRLNVPKFVRFWAIILGVSVIGYGLSYNIVNPSKVALAQTPQSFLEIQKVASQSEPKIDESVQPPKVVVSSASVSRGTGDRSAEALRRLQSISTSEKVSMDYLQYIIKTEKTFNLPPFELVALIDKETGFVPNTHMDAGSLSYNTTQMKLPTAKTAQEVISTYYKMDLPKPTDSLLRNDTRYATVLAGGYLRYLSEAYLDHFEVLTAYNYGIAGRKAVYASKGNYLSAYAQDVDSRMSKFQNIMGDYYNDLQ